MKVRKLTCKNCEHVRYVEVDFVSMNMDCPNCNSLAFGLIRNEIVESPANQLTPKHKGN